MNVRSNPRVFGLLAIALVVVMASTASAQTVFSGSAAQVNALQITGYSQLSLLSNGVIVHDTQDSYFQPDPNDQNTRVYGLPGIAQAIQYASNPVVDDNNYVIYYGFDVKHGINITDDPNRDVSQDNPNNGNASLMGVGYAYVPDINASGANPGNLQSWRGTAVSYTDNDPVNGSTDDTIIGYAALGDADLSGTVDVGDFYSWNAGLSGFGTGWSFGGFDYTGDANINDFYLWNAGLTFAPGNLFIAPTYAGSGSALPAALSAPTTVPEPAAVVLLSVFGLVCLGGWVRRARG
jgi:hypothetical protein